MQQSLWSLPEVWRHPVLRGRKEADAAVVGGGITGLTCALWLSRAGLKVALIEAETIGFGTSSRCAGTVTVTNRLLYHQLEEHAGRQTAEKYAQTMQHALRAVGELASKGRCGWQEATAMLAGDAHPEQMEAEAEAMTRAGISAVLKRGREDVVLETASMGMLDPAGYLQLLADSALRQGVDIFEGSRVMALETGEAHALHGTVHAPYLIIATGYPVINVPGWYFLKIRQQEGALRRMHGPCALDGMWFAADGSFAVRPHAHGALAQCWGAEETEKRLEAESGMHFMQERFTGLECFTPDGLPYIGQYGRKTPNLFVASGYEGKGILGGMMAAQAVTARVLGLPCHGYDIYSGQRRLSNMTIPLGTGVRYAKGVLMHPGAPRCPHMGCRLVYDPRGRMWRCPCHGSRFDDIGHVLNAPAVRDAELKDRRQKK